MKSAHELFDEFIASSFKDPVKASELFAEDGAFEMPYLASLGMPWRFQGREKIAAFFEYVRYIYPDMEFQDAAIVCEAQDTVIAEYGFTAKSSKTGRMIHQLSVARFKTYKGRITLLRESVNLVELCLGIYPNGLADYKLPDVGR